MHVIEQVVSENHPHLLGISESNLKNEHDLQNVQLQDYDLVTSKTFNNEHLLISRVVCYKHHSLVGKSEMISIWLEFGLPSKIKFLVCRLG